jgi:hypothetical protein
LFCQIGGAPGDIHDAHGVQIPIAKNIESSDAGPGDGRSLRMAWVAQALDAVRKSPRALPKQQLALN